MNMGRPLRAVLAMSSNAPSPSQLTSRNCKTVRAECFHRTNDDLPFGGIEMHNINWVASRHTNAAPLADSIFDNAFMTTKHATIEMDDFHQVLPQGDLVWR